MNPKIKEKVNIAQKIFRLYDLSSDHRMIKESNTKGLHSDRKNGIKIEVLTFFITDEYTALGSELSKCDKHITLLPKSKPTLFETFTKACAPSSGDTQPFT